jgi:hypothetical protein
MRYGLTLFILAALLVGPISANAEPILYGLMFEVDYLDASAPIAPRVEIGDRFFGSFMIESGILGADGLNKGGELIDLGIRFEDVSWCFNLSCPDNVFEGFRGPDEPFLGAPSPGFDVLHGEIVNLRGGVFGGADYPFINFSTDLNAPFPGDCSGAYCGNHPNSFWTVNPLGAFGGSMLVNRVPEQGTFSLLAVGLIGFGTVRLAARSFPRSVSDNR